MEMTPSSRAGAGSKSRVAAPSFLDSLALALILALSALLRAWHLNQVGYGTQYYAAGVRSMLGSWHNFWFNSFDPVGFVSMDKPPLALWPQVLSAKIFGFSGWSIHLPQVMEGIGSVALLYYLVQRRFGRGAGLLAALFLAITPISVAVDRSNNADSFLVLGLLAAAWALSVATESGSRRMLFVSMALIGIAFNINMLVAAVVLPAYMLTYLLGAPLPMARKVASLSLAAGVSIAVALLWCVSYDLTPAAARPYVGSTQTNSMLELMAGPNGLRHFVQARGNERSAAEPAPAAPIASGGNTAATAKVSAAEQSPDTASFSLRGADGVPSGVFRLANPLLADQMGWLYPLAAMALLAGLWRRRFHLPLERADAALLLWVSWILIYGVALSCAGGVFHAYYLAVMAPPVCALAAVGLVRLWRWYGQGAQHALALPLSLVAVAAWQIYVGHGYLTSLLSDPLRSASSQLRLEHILIAATLLVTALAVGGLLLARNLEPGQARAWSRAWATAGVVAMLLTPTVWAMGSMQMDLRANSPTARLPDMGAQRFVRTVSRSQFSAADQQLVAFLTDNYHDERFLLATLSAQQAAPLIIATGMPVMAMGGYAGTDPILTPESFSRMVQQKQLRFVLIGATGPSGLRARAVAVQAPLVTWVQQHGLLVDAALWRTPSLRSAAAKPTPGGRRERRLANALAPQLFDLRPDSDPTMGSDYDTPVVLARLTPPR
jgi:4-amino-4-deoxy-L-arabinose transferase-like glycosyltransferase